LLVGVFVFSTGDNHLTSLGEAVLELDADYGPLKNSVGDAKGFVGSALGTLGGIAGGVLAAGVGVAAGAFGILSGALGFAIGEASDSQQSLAQLDAVLKSTGASATKQADDYAAASKKFSTATKLSSADLLGLQDDLAHASAKLNDIRAAWDKAKTHTESGALALEDAKAKVAGLQAAIADGSQTITTNLANALGLVPPVAQMSRDALIGLADSLSGVTRFTDEAIISGESMLLTFTGIGKDVFPDVTKVMLDVSQAMGQDLKSSAIQLGKALNDPTKGISALTRVGVTFTEEQKNLIKSLQDTGDVAGAQRIILAELEKEFGGSAEAAGKTFAGQLDILRNKLSNVAEDVGNKFLPLIQDGLTKVGPIIEILAQKFGDFLGSPMIQSGFQALVTGLDLVLNALSQIVSGDIVGGLTTLFGPTVAGQIVTTLTQVGAFIMGTLLPTLINLGTWFTTQGIPALQNFWVLVQTNLLPALGQLGAWFTTQGLPALQGFWAWVQANLLPLLTQLWGIFAQGGTQTLPQLTTFWNTVLMPALMNFWVWVQANLLPLLTEFWTWFQVNLPVAVQALVDVWNTVLLPALIAYWTWMVATLFPLLGQLWTWLQANLPAALQTLSNFWTGTLQPAITAVWAWITGTLIPMLTSLWTWLKTTVPAALQMLSNFWTGTLLPAITSVWSWMSVTLFPFFKWLEHFLSAVFNLTLTALAGVWQNVVLPALKSVWSFLNDKVFPIFKSIGDYVSVTLSPVFKAVGDYLRDTLGPILSGLASGGLTAVKGAFDGISSAISGVTDWLQRMADKINSIHLPDWATPGSPTPFELGLRGMASALGDLTSMLPEFQAGMQFSPSALAANMSLAGAGGGNTSSFTQNVYPSSELDIAFLAQQVAREIQRRQN